MATRVPFPRLELLCAMDATWGIGRNGALPWHIPKEFKYYIRLSKKQEDPNKPNVAIFGRKTWDSLCALKLEPMAKCINVIISRNMDPSEIAKYKDVYVCRSLEGAIEMLKTPQFKDNIGRVWVHGGSDIYKEAMKSDHFYRLYLSKIHKSYECDVFFPKFDETKLEEVEDPDALQGLQEDKGVQFQVHVYQTKGECALLP
ncbi:hypothetical protein QYM36_004873 [Artemia franciscana]|uniref:dihydrofolate reductase n=1 Tax=Artemia franciscana TaxID=6661 RepID=A0AA88I3L6_ARTSF|nr:hypothetical protein QYM36_004873 [Artemia franciscana]